MRRILSSGFVMVAGMVSIPGTVTNHLVERTYTPAAQFRMDPRLGTLRTFFEEMNCPALAVSEVFLQASDAYGLDWRLLPSISFVESEGGKTARNNNLFGWNAGRAEFSSVTAAIHAVAFSLANSSLYKNKNLDELLGTYNPNSDYAQRVKSVMQQISPSE